MIKPAWLRKPPVAYMSTLSVRRILSEGDINTVCRHARCPNMGECYSSGAAAFMILGSACSRGCGFCAVESLKGPASVDPGEPDRVAQAAAALKLSHVVVTSVTRDDLPDGGAGQFARTIAALRQCLPSAAVEVLTPDFLGDEDAIGAVIGAAPDVYNHNVETVPALYRRVRPKAVYERSLSLLRLVKERAPGITTKSGIMLGLGETVEQVRQTMRDLASAGCDALTIGQYLRPTLQNLPVVEYVHPSVFEDLERAGVDMGFSHVFSGPFVRSSYHAGEILKSS